MYLRFQEVQHAQEQQLFERAMAMRRQRQAAEERMKAGPQTGQMARLLWVLNKH
eukprot:COSAG06_NODE_284_length_18336_cov_5.847124_6_plen_54_part_00